MNVSTSHTGGNQQDIARQDTDPDLWSYHLLGDQNFWSARGLLSWWYRLTSPPDASAQASFPQRDRVRRGRLASALMLFLLTVLLIASTIGWIGSNHMILTVTTTMFLAILLCIPLNRRGWIEVVGMIMALGLTGGMYTSMLTAPGGMSPADKDILYLLIFSDLFVASLLPVNWVWLVATLNICFSVYALSFGQHTPALAAQLAHGGASIILFRVIQMHVIISGVVWILIGNLKAAIRRADRAEELARLERDVAQMSSEQAQEKAILERSIAEIVEAHRRIANGEFHARVPYTQGNVLWSVAGQLNNLLGRYQRAKETEQAYFQLLQRLSEAQAVLHRVVQRALQEHQPLQFPQGTTSFDLLFQELQGHYLVRPAAVPVRVPSTKLVPPTEDQR